jgi:hypothetical protein
MNFAAEPERGERTICPRLTVSITAVQRSSVGAAELQPGESKGNSPNRSQTVTMKIAVRARFFSLNLGALNIHQLMLN